VHLPEPFGLILCLQHVRPQQACAEAALFVEVACDPALTPRARRMEAAVLQERDELTLGLGITLDVALRHGETGMAREFLHIPETPPNL
jgi:hypothetical protein